MYSGFWEVRCCIQYCKCLDHIRSVRFNLENYWECFFLGKFLSSKLTEKNLRETHIFKILSLIFIAFSRIQIYINKRPLFYKHVVFPFLSDYHENNMVFCFLTTDLIRKLYLDTLKIQTCVHKKCI